MSDAVGYKMYGELAGWYHLLTAPADYAEEAADALAMLTARAEPLRRILELGSGGGNLASHLSGDHDMTLTDLSSAILAQSQTINPNAEHVAGDMRTLRLQRRDYDAVIVHDAVMYMTSEADLAAAIETAHTHLRPGGVALFLPDNVRETFAAETECGGHDDPNDGRGMRYLEWSYDRDPADDTFEVVYVFTLREADGSVRTVTEQHRMGLFGRDHWREAIATAGFVDVDSRVDPWKREVFIATRPG